MRAALAELGVSYDRLRDIEHDAALGNGGLGRLAACFMESMATLGIAAHGYGIRYDHGMFRQVIQRRLAAGISRELADLRQSVGGRPAGRQPIRSASAARSRPDSSRMARPASLWHPAEIVDAVAYDTPVIGWRGHYRQYLAALVRVDSDPLRLDAFNRGDHVGALAERARANAISQVLYPERRDAGGPGAAAAAGILLHLRLAAGPGRPAHAPADGDIRIAARQGAIQLNDTHPAIAVAELMRILVDLHEIPWDEAWQITTGHDFLYQPHAAARGAGKLAGLADGASAAAPHADRVSDQSAAPGCRLRTATDRWPAAGGAFADR